MIVFIPPSLVKQAMPNQIKEIGRDAVDALTQLAESQLDALDALAQY